MTLIWSWFSLLVLNALIIQFANIVFNNFASMFLSEIDPQCFSSYSCTVLILRLSSNCKRIGSLSLLFYALKQFAEGNNYLFLEDLLKFTCETIFSFPVSWGHGNRVEEEETLIGFFRLSTFLWVRFGKLYFF